MTGDSEFDPEMLWLAERDGALVGRALQWTGGWRFVTKWREVVYAWSL